MLPLDVAVSSWKPLNVAHWTFNTAGRLNIVDCKSTVWKQVEAVETSSSLAHTCTSAQNTPVVRPVALRLAVIHKVTERSADWMSWVSAVGPGRQEALAAHHQDRDTEDLHIFTSRTRRNMCRDRVYRDADGNTLFSSWNGWISESRCAQPGRTGSLIFIHHGNGRTVWTIWPPSRSWRQ